MKIARILFAVVPLLALGGAFAQDKTKKITVATDPKDAGIDFAIQGEYLTDEKDAPGAQVVARGGGKFDVFILEGGLPGDGWDGKSRSKSTGTLDADGKTVTFKGKVYNGTIDVGDRSFLHATSDNKGKFDCIRIVRKSRTLGARPPAGARVLFDGTSAGAWKEGKLEGDLLKVPATTKDSFTIAQLHVEFITPFMPYASGQGRGNSGVYVFGKEIQVLDSFGLEGKKDECGAFYGQRAPDVNMCYPPLSWQTYDVDIKTEPADPDTKKKAAVKFTVYHNGVKIHDGVDVGTGSSGGIHLQDHGNPVFYRNIWLVEAK